MGRRFEPLTIEEARDVYYTHMVKDFPPSERRPFFRIEKGMASGKFEVLGYRDENNELLAYAILVKTDNDYLFDYLAVIDGNRNGGIGGEFLKSVSAFHSDSDSIIGEVEDPDFAKSEEDRKLQERRYRFYLRSGVIDTGLRVKLFGVHYRVLEVDLGYAHSKEETSALYKKHYKSTLPLPWYLTKVKIKK